jgi:hypothetical protein
MIRTITDQQHWREQKVHSFLLLQNFFLSCSCFCRTVSLGNTVGSVAEMNPKFVPGSESEHFFLSATLVMLDLVLAVTYRYRTGTRTGTVF